MTFELLRRDFLKGLAGVIAFASAPAIVRSASIMAVKAPKLIIPQRQEMFVLMDDLGLMAPTDQAVVTINGVKYYSRTTPTVYKSPLDGPYGDTARQRVIHGYNGREVLTVVSGVPKSRP